MSVIKSDVIPASAPAGGYTIDQSLRFNDGDSPKLKKTYNATAGNRKNWTFSTWVKFSNLGSDVTQDYSILLEGRIDSANNSQIAIAHADGYNDQIYWQEKDVTTWHYISNLSLRDTSSWYHLVFVYDSTNSTASERRRVYINGEKITSWATQDSIPQNQNAVINGENVEHGIGNLGGGLSGGYHDGYMAEVNFIDGQSLDSSYFGETGDYGEWKPIEYTGSYGTKGYYLNFSNASSLGEDSSGNGNDWTATNLATTDVVLDSPTNNFASMNSITVNGTGALSEGNLQVYSSGDNGGGGISTISMASGKWYVEGYVKSVGSNTVIGLAEVSEAGSYTIGYAPSNVSVVNCESLRDRCAYRNAGGSYTTLETLSGTYTTGDVIGVAVDMDNGRVYFSKNNGWMDNSDGWTNSTPTNYLDLSLPSISEAVILVGNANATNPSTWVLNFGQDSSFAGNKTAQGNTDDNEIGDFYYTPPSGYLALCTANLSDPDVIPSEHFNTVLYAGDGTSSNSITGVGFQPDFVWIKPRNLADHHRLNDAVRGVNKTLISNSTATEYTTSNNFLDSFDSDGFTIGSSDNGWNGSSYNYVSWNWLADNTSGSSNTDGSITSTVSANQDAGFSIVSYTGDGTSNPTIGHGLSSAPEIVILKVRSLSDDWQVFGNGTNFNRMKLNSTDANLTTNGATLSTSTITLPAFNNAWNGTDVTYIAYAFHSVDGFSKVGKYDGNGSTDGTFVYTGFRPAFVIVKCINQAGHNWQIADNRRDEYNVEYHRLLADSSASEYTNFNMFDFTSNGFKLRNSEDWLNYSGNSYLYIAFAENPFKYTNAR